MKNRGVPSSMAGWIMAVLLLVVVPAGCDAQEDAATAGDGLTDTELEAMIDSLLPSISEASGLAVRRPVQSSMQEREDARAFIEQQLEEELGTGELEGTERAYKAFGLLPDTLDLRSLLLELYTEQVVGYYDPKTDQLYVVDGVAAETAAPVVAHELVHSLQDQHTDLEALIAGDRGNDRQLAAQAAAEGQATLVMIALQAAQTTGRAIDPAALPDLGPLLGPAMEAENSQFPVFRRAPRLIKRTLIFPYMGGAAFVQALLRSQPGTGPAVPFDELLPQSTEQVLEPAEHFIGQRDHPTDIELDQPAGGWTTVYTNTLGQLETSILLTEHLGEAAASAAQGWDGDRYALMEGPGGDEALIWYSVWDDSASADRFAVTYRRLLRQRAGTTGLVERMEVEGRPVVKVVSVPAGMDPAEVPAPAVTVLEERR